MSGKRRAEDAAVPAAAEADELEFEDEYGDEFEDEEMASAEEEGGEDGAEAGRTDGLQPRSGGRMWRASDGMGSGEALDYDSSAYQMLHRMHTEWPCLSFGVVRDALGATRTKFPLTCFMVAGTQAERSEQNALLCMKLSKLCKTKHDGASDDDDSDDSDSDDEDGDPMIESQALKHPGGVNRLKLMPQARRGRRRRAMQPRASLVSLPLDLPPVICRRRATSAPHGPTRRRCTSGTSRASSRTSTHPARHHRRAAGRRRCTRSKATRRRATPSISRPSRRFATWRPW